MSNTKHQNCFSLDTQSAPRCRVCNSPMMPIWGYYSVSSWKCYRHG